MEKNMIKFEDVLAFIEKAIMNNFDITFSKEKVQIQYSYTISNSKEYITIYIFSNGTTIAGTGGGCIHIEHKLSSREILTLDKFCIEINELREKQLLSRINNFFKDDSKPVDINDLDNDEE